MELNYIGTPVEGINQGKFKEFKEWFKSLRIAGFDVETNVVSSILDRELRTLQFADKTTVWVLQWSYLTVEEQYLILHHINESHRKLIIHSGTFEGTMMLKYGVILKNIWDSYRAEQILNTGKGKEQGQFDLASIYQARFGLALDKQWQDKFGDNIMTYDKIIYAGMDVAKAIELYELQLSEMKSFDKSFKQHHHKGLVKTAWWDNEFTLVASDLEYQGVLIDQQKWMECYNKYFPKMQEAKNKLDSIVIRDFKEFAIEQGWLSEQDRFESIWGSTEKKKEILQLVFPNIESVTKLGLKEYLRDNDPGFPWIEDPKHELPDDFKPIEEAGRIEKKLRRLKITGKEWETNDYVYQCPVNDKFTILKLLILDSKETNYTDALNEVFYQNFPEFMLSHNYVIPANTLSLNWASSSQKLQLFQYINPKIESTDALTIESNLLAHELFRVYEEYQDAASLVTKFGVDYLKHVEADGRIRTRFNTILSTGRISSINPNLLQLPQNQDYRACFTAPQGFKFIGADFESEELVVLATLANEHIWLDAVRHHKDIHSVNAALLYEKEWDRATEPECNFVKNKQKCNCKGHKEMRKASKQLSFGVVYGISSYGFAARTHKSEEESQRLITKFFNTFTSIESALTKWGKFGVQSQKINEDGTGRVRFFDSWKVAKREDFYGNWVYANPEEMRGVMRASQNFPIQSFSASVLKVACVLFRRWINNNGLREHIQLILPVHDELLVYVRDTENYVQLAKEKLEYYMKISGKLLLKNDLLRATANVSNYWIKD